METYKNLKKSTKIGLIISLIFVVLGIGFTIYNLVGAPAPTDIPGGMGGMPSQDESVFAPQKPLVRGLKDGIYLVLYLLTAFYAVIGHKKPHGNLLKYLFFTFAVTLVLNVCLGGVGTTVVSLIVALFACLAALLLTYVAGRLHKIEKNRILLIVTGVLLLVSQMLPAFGAPFHIAPFMNALTPLIILLALGFAYTARYEEHKAAGLADKAEAENI